MRLSSSTKVFFLLCFGPLNSATDSLAQDLLVALSDPSLHAMVQKDLLQLQDDLAVGGISTFFFTVNCQVSVWQETTDFLHSLIQKLDIWNFNGQNVSLPLKSFVPLVSIWEAIFLLMPSPASSMAWPKQIMKI